MQIQTNRLDIRPGISQDADDLFAIRNDDAILRYNCMKKVSFEIWEEEVLFGKDLYFLYEREKKRAIGCIQFQKDSLRYQTKTLEIAYWLDPKFWKQGYMKEGLEGMISYLFSIGYVGITARAFADNKDSIKILESIGFVKEGELKDAVVAYNGILYDDCLFYLANNKEKI